ncbi:MAG TPA: PAS domain S-box protein, partial [Ferruginibacter sp.]|nr:PAS domain S-box protein [Ferruginibacter sp.]
MKLYTELKLYIFFAIILIIILLGWQSQRNTTHHRNTLTKLEQSHEVLIRSEELSSIIENIETSVRGYIITGNSSLLPAFKAASKKIFSNLSELQLLTSYNPSQQKRIDSLRILVRQKVNFSNLVITYRDAQGYKAAQDLITGGEAIEYMNEFRDIIKRFQEEEKNILAVRKADNIKTVTAFNRASNIQLAAIIFILVTSFFLVRDNLLKRKKAQHKVIESERSLKTFFNAAPDAVIVINQEQEIIEWNPTAEKLFGFNAGEVRGQLFSETIIPVQYREAHKQEMDGFIKTGESKALNKTIEITALHKSSREFFINLSISNVKMDGKWIFIAFISDITEIKKQNDLVRDLYDNAPFGYYSLNSNGEFINANNTLLKWLGYTKEELIGMQLTAILTREDKKDFNWRFDVFKEKGFINDLELQYIRKDGTSMTVLINASAVKNESGEFLYSRSNIVDISLRKKLEMELVAINAELESFTYSVSHDLRAPLRVMNGYAELIAEKNNRLNIETKRMLNNIIANSKRMSRLIDDLLNFSRMGKKELVTHDTNMTAIVETILLEQLNGKNNYTIKLHPLPQCICDSNLIKQVWENLISNAIKYSSNKKKPSIEIGSTEEINGTVFYIKDNGAGFDMEYYD